MSYYSEWQQITNKVLELIRGNDNLLKLAYYPDDFPYEKDTPLWDDVLMKNIFPMPKEPVSVGEQKSFINVYMTSAYPSDDIYYRDDYVCIEVGCHLEVWKMDGGEIRPYSMLTLIDEMINNKSIGDMSIQKVLPESTKVIKFGDMFYGYRMLYKLTNPGGIHCGNT